MGTPSLPEMGTSEQVVLELCPWLPPGVAFAATNKQQHTIRYQWHSLLVRDSELLFSQNCAGSYTSQLFNAIHLKTICPATQQLESLEICQNIPKHFLPDQLHLQILENFWSKHNIKSFSTGTLLPDWVQILWQSMHKCTFIRPIASSSRLSNS